MLVRNNKQPFKNVRRTSPVAGKLVADFSRAVRGIVIHGVMSVPQHEVKAGVSRVLSHGRAKGPVSTRIANISQRFTTQRKKSVLTPLDEQYDLFSTLSRLSEASPDNSALQNQMSDCLAEIRRLQRIEAESIEHRILHSLYSPIGEGLKALEEANALIAIYANSATSDSAAE